MNPFVKFMDRDFSGEPTSFSLYLPDITNANFETYRDTNIPDIITDLQAVTLLDWTSWDMVTEVHMDVGTLPSSPYAQREQRAIFKCIDTTTGRYFDVGVPCPDLTDMAIPGTDVINLTDTEVAAYVTALQTYARSPEGNALTVISGIVKGVNN